MKTMIDVIKQGYVHHNEVLLNLRIQTRKGSKFQPASIRVLVDKYQCTRTYDDKKGDIKYYVVGYMKDQIVFNSIVDFIIDEKEHYLGDHEWNM